MTRRAASGAGFVGAASRRPGAGRQARNFYPTPANVSRPFLEAERARIAAIAAGAPIVEPASGADDLVREIEAFGFAVEASDVHPLGRGRRLDFRRMRRRPKGARILITNPPFEGLAEAFIRHAAQLGFAYLGLLLKTTWFNTRRGLALWNWWRPTIEYRITWRVDFLRGGTGRSFLDLSWFVWVGAPAPDRPDPTLRLIARPA